MTTGGTKKRVAENSRKDCEENHREPYMRLCDNKAYYSGHEGDWWWQQMDRGALVNCLADCQFTLYQRALMDTKQCEREGKSHYVHYCENVFQLSYLEMKHNSNYVLQNGFIRCLQEQCQLITYWDYLLRHSCEAIPYLNEKFHKIISNIQAAYSVSSFHKHKSFQQDNQAFFLENGS